MLRILGPLRLSCVVTHDGPTVEAGYASGVKMEVMC